MDIMALSQTVKLARVQDADERLGTSFVGSDDTSMWQVRNICWANS